MRRIEPTFPDLLPLSHRLGEVPVREEAVALDLVTMRLVRQPAPPRWVGEIQPPRRPVRVLVHAGVVRRGKEALATLLAAGCGVLLVLDEPLEPEDLPVPLRAEQVTVVNIWLSPFWGQIPLFPLKSFRAAGYTVGTVIAMAPQLPLRKTMGEAVASAQGSGAEFVLLIPLVLSGEEKHKAYERAFGENGNGDFEDLLFHTEAGDVARSLEVFGSVWARRAGLREALAGPSTAACQASCFAAACSLLLWARRMDLLDGVSSQGWRLRRAAQALLASGRDPAQLMEEDNLRLIPGFDPWVEAFARSLWSGEGEPFASVWLRWLEQAD